MAVLMVESRNSITTAEEQIVGIYDPKRKSSRILSIATLHADQTIDTCSGTVAADVLLNETLDSSRKNTTVKTKLFNINTMKFPNKQLIPLDGNPLETSKLASMTTERWCKAGLMRGPHYRFDNT
jgi:hypothetical protein